MILSPAMDDQLLGIGDGLRTSFPLVKHYGEDDQLRRITRPKDETVMVAINGIWRRAGY